MHLLAIGNDAAHTLDLPQDLPQCDLRVAQSLDEGLDLIQHQSFDAVFVDITLLTSAQSGLGRIQASAPNLPVVLICDASEEERAMAAVLGGAQDYLVRGQRDRPDLAHMLRVAAARQAAQERMRRSHTAQGTELRRLASRLELAVRAGEIGIWDWDVRSDTLVWNDRMFTIYGVDPTAFGGNDAAFRRHIHPDDLPHMLDHIPEVMSGKAPIIDEFRIVRPDRTIRYVSAAAILLMDSQGGPERMIGLNWDVTERKRAEEALRESEARLKILFEELPDAFAFGDLAGCCLEINPAFEQLTGISRGQIIGKSFRDLQLIVPSDRWTFHDGLQQVLAGEPSAPMEIILCRPDGANRAVELRIFPVSVSGQAMMLIWMRDITQRKQAEEYLRQSEEQLRRANAELSQAMRLKDEFLASMSHELRTPLGTILGLAESLDEGIYGPLLQRQHTALRDIAGSGQHLLNLINDILDLSKIEADRLSLAPQLVLVADLCEASMRLVREQALQKHLCLATTIAPEARAVLGDPRRLKQILVNLLSNAVKFTPAGGHIGLEVTLAPDLRFLHFVVWDTGIGIEPAQIDLLFQPFVQLDSNLSRQYSGTGLGLALVRSLAEMHGGTVAVTSVPSVGSRFTVALPRADDGLLDAGSSGQEAALFGKQPTAEAGPVPGPHGRILIAEDNQLNHEMVHDYLQLKGYTVISAWDGAQAIAEAQACRPDLILMDIQMPGMDGIEAIQRLRSIPSLGAVPIIAVTALAMAGDRERCLATGASAYIAKPIALKALHSLIAELLADRPAARPDVV